MAVVREAKLAPLPALLCLVLLFASASLTSTATAAWPQDRADAQNTASVGSPEPGNGSLQWDQGFPHRLVGSPAVSDDMVLVMAEEVHALGLDTGEQRWSFLPVWGNFTSPPGWLQAGPVSDGGRVFLSTAYPSIHALDLQTGEEVWRWNTANIPRSLAIGDGRGYAALDENVSAFDGGDGEEDWRFRAGARLSGVSLADGVVYASTRAPVSESYRVYALDAATGERIWSHETGAPMAGPPAVGAEHVFVGSARQEGGPAALWALDRDDGEVSWRTETEADVRQPVTVSEGTVLATTGGDGDDPGRILAVEAGTGERVWMADDRIGPVAVSEGIVYVAGGLLQGLSIEDGEPVRDLINATPADDVAMAGGVLLAADGGHLRALDAGRPIGDRGDVPVGAGVAVAALVLVAVLRRAARRG